MGVTQYWMVSRDHSPSETHKAAQHGHSAWPVIFLEMAIAIFAIPHVLPELCHSPIKRWSFFFLPWKLGGPLWLPQWIEWKHRSHLTCCYGILVLGIQSSSCEKVQVSLHRKELGLMANSTDLQTQEWAIVQTWASSTQAPDNNSVQIADPKNS